MALTWTIIVLVALAAYIVHATFKKNKNGRTLPPGPRGLPILGHLHLLGKYPNRDLHELAKKHGPIMYMRFGFVQNIIVSTPEAAEQFLKTHDLNFANRPPIEAAKYMSYEQRNLTFAEYGPYWRNVRKLSTLELLSNLKMSSFKSMRSEELGLMIRSIGEAAKDGGVVDLSTKVSVLNGDITGRMVFGRKYTDEDFNIEKGFKGVMKLGMELASTPNLGDFFPLVGALDLQGLNRRMKKVSKVFDEFLERIIDEHVQAKEQRQTKDFVDVLLAFMESEEAEFKIERSHVKAILLDMLSAAMDTTSTAVEWVVSLLLKHPRVMKKVQKELEDVVGMSRMVEEQDLERLEYLEMVVKETLRLYPVVPLLLPHQAIQDCTIDGFHIPKNSRVSINVWAIGRDPNAWTDPEEFIPERFVGSSIDVRGRHFQLIPFGSGRRGCPGMQLGLTMVRLVVAQLVHCFDWELPNGMLPTELDMTEKFGFVLSRLKSLVAVPTYRLHI